MRFFEDIAVGEHASFGSYRVTREEVLEFARKYDPQPFHLSDEAAAKTYFGRLAASGWHSCAMAMAMLVADNVENPSSAVGSPGIDDLRWLKPVYPGDTLRCETRVLETRPSSSRPEIGSARRELVMFNQHDEPVLRFVARILYQTRAGAAAAARCETAPAS